MGRFEPFELSVNKVQDYPLVFEALIPKECSLFQDIRRYQSITSNLDVKVINIDGRIQMEQGYVPISIANLSSAEKKDFIEYLKLRITRGDNIGSLWRFFRSEDKKRAVAAIGANVVYKDSAAGYSRAVHLLTELQKSSFKSNKFINIILSAIVILLILGSSYIIYDKFIKGKEFKLSSLFSIGKYLPGTQSKEMQFYESIFPDIYEWLYSDVVDQQIIAKELLKPEYISDIINSMDKPFYQDSSSEQENSSYSGKKSDNYRGTRLALFIYFNYNADIKESLEKYKYKLESTEFGRLAKIYSCSESGYSSNIFYFKVGDLDIKYPQINQYLTENSVSYNDYTRLRDADGFSEILKKDDVNFKLKNFLSDVYTFTPLKIENPIENIDWYLLTKSYSNGKLNFAAFFKQKESTMIPRDISSELIMLMNLKDNKQLQNSIETSDNLETSGNISKESSLKNKDNIFTWYKIDDDQKKNLNLRDYSTTYFTDKIGQNFKLEAVERKIKELELEKIEGIFPVSIHRDLLMEDSKGKYGIQCYDPITSLVLSNLISNSSFEAENKIILKRDPIQINTSLIQLSKDDSSSTQVINISPGKTGIVNLFKDIDHFRGKLINGNDVRFERADINLFNPFSFTVYDDSITFSYKHEISGMEFSVNKKILKIAKSEDGGYQIIEIN